MPSTVSLKPLPLMRNQLRQANYHFDDELGTATFFMKPEPRPCFNLHLLYELKSFQQAVARKVFIDIKQNGESSLKYSILASEMPGIFNLGGDLKLFLELIKKQDKETLQHYAETCIEIAHQMCISMDSPLTTIALVQGTAQGGGLEGALSCNVIIAERGTQMGFPEVLFNLFPGMGAYSFLRQRVNASLAERIILSGKLYSAEEFFELGIVDVLAEPGQGQQALRDYIRQSNRRSNAQSLIRHTRKEYNKVSYEELHEITSMWVESAMKISERELKTMSRLVRAQNNKIKNMQAERRSSLI